MNTQVSSNGDRAYPFRVEPDEEGGYFIVFPDLPGCMTQVETADEIGPAADEIKTLWLETARDHDMAIPPPAAPASHSGRFVVRVPRTLHRDLVDSAAREGVSLNQYVAVLLARNDALARVERRLAGAVALSEGEGGGAGRAGQQSPRRRRAGLSLVSGDRTS